MRQQIKQAALGPPEQGAPPSDVFIKAGQCRRQRYFLDEDFVGFQGHFEGNPVLPALAQVFMAQDMIENLEGRPVTLAAINQAKFIAPVGPGRTVTVYAATGTGPGDWCLHLTFLNEVETDAAFLRLTVEQAHGL